MTSPAVADSESPSGAKQIKVIFGGLKQLPTLRNAVRARALSPLDALNFYSQGPAATNKLFLIQTESVTLNDQQIQAVGLIATVQAREQLSQEDALLSGMLAAKRITAKNRIAFNDLAATRQADAAYADYVLSPANLATYNAALAGSGTMMQSLAGIEQAIAASGLSAHVVTAGAKGCVVFAEEPVTSYRGFLGVDDRYSHAHWLYQHNGGVFLPPWGKIEQWLISVQHDQADIDRLIDNFAVFARAAGGPP